ncbi:MAG: esterase [Opitutus sp.]|nr:esterase [Opitutus sp.]
MRSDVSRECALGDTRASERRKPPRAKITDFALRRGAPHRACCRLPPTRNVPPSMPPPEPTRPSRPAFLARGRVQREARLRVLQRFHSRIFRNSRDVTVWTPPGYGDPRRRHPVIYFQDGQNIFDPKTAFGGHAWNAGETTADLIKRRTITPPILVGIGNTGANRINEYTPTRADYEIDGGKARSAGDAKRYARFVVTELKPFIDARYLTLPGPRTTSLVGSSMGGLVSLYTALWHPRVFGSVAALSPSLWWDNRIALRDFGSLKRRLDVRLWIDMGTAEPGWEVAQLFRDTLVNAGWTLGENLEYHEIPGAEHSEQAWAARLGAVLNFLAGRSADAR